MDVYGRTSVSRVRAPRAACLSVFNVLFVIQERVDGARGLSALW